MAVFRRKCSRELLIFSCFVLISEAKCGGHVLSGRKVWQSFYKVIHMRYSCIICTRQYLDGKRRKQWQNRWMAQHFMFTAVAWAFHKKRKNMKCCAIQRFCHCF